MKCEQISLGKHDILRYIKRGKKNEQRKVGMLVAITDDSFPKHVGIGFSLCRVKCDKFDKNRGLTIAIQRAKKYVLSDTDPKNHNGNSCIPASLNDHLIVFADQCIRYYKDKLLPKWIEKRLEKELEKELDLDLVAHL